MLIEYTGKEQLWASERTVYWFTLSGADYSEGLDFQDSEYGIAENDTDSFIVDCFGVTVPSRTPEYNAIRKHCVVTDRMRME